MEKPVSQPKELEKPSVRASDMELALFFMTHIDSPCEAEIESGRKENIRKFYVREATKALKNMTNSTARRLLEEKIEEYSNF